MAYSYIRKGNIGMNRHKANGIIYRSIQSNFATDMYVCVYTKQLCCERECNYQPDVKVR